MIFSQKEKDHIHNFQPEKITLKKMITKHAADHF